MTSTKSSKESTYVSYQTSCFCFTHFFLFETWSQAISVNSSSFPLHKAFITHLLDLYHWFWGMFGANYQISVDTLGQHERWNSRIGLSNRQAEADPISFPSTASQRTSLHINFTMDLLLFAALPCSSHLPVLSDPHAYSGLLIYPPSYHLITNLKIGIHNDIRPALFFPVSVNL